MHHFALSMHYGVQNTFVEECMRWVMALMALMAVIALTGWSSFVFCRASVVAAATLELIGNKVCEHTKEDETNPQ